MSKFPGIGVMIQSLGGNEETVKAVKASLGKKISAIKLENDCLSLTFKDNTVLTLRDSGQSCCEHRYMSTDDNFEDYVGGKLTDLELRDAPNIQAEYDEHEVQFLVVKTSKGQFTMANHNEHNGYYGGFYIEARLS